MSSKSFPSHTPPLKTESKNIITQLTKTIAHLEKQRPILGDVVVDMAQAPLNQKLAELTNPPPTKNAAK